MIKLTLREIVEAAEGEMICGSGKNSVRGISIDSRTIRQGEYFVAVKGKKFDGHDHIDDALEKGAEGVIAEASYERGIRHQVKNLILVDDSVKAMEDIAGLVRSHVNIPVFAITGTNGKTTTKDFLAQILSSRYSVHKSPASYNNRIGLCLTMFGLDHRHEVLVLEIGTNHPGEIAHLGKIARPHVAVFTNIGDGHLEAFIDRQGVFTEKTSLIDFLPAEGLVILNADDAFLSRASVRGVAKRFYGTKDGSDYKMTNMTPVPEGYSFNLNEEEYFAPVDGAHNVYNAACAIAAAKHLGLSYPEIRSAVGRLELPALRLQKVQVGNVLFVNDSYNANPSSFECALDAFNKIAEGKNKVVVAGDMMELGKTAEEYHRVLGRSIAGKNFDHLITMGQWAKQIQEGAVEFGMDENSVMRADDHEHAAMLLEKISDGDTAVLLKASRSSRMEEILKCFTSCSTR